MKNNQSKSVTKLLASSTGLNALMRLGDAMPKSRPSLNLNLRPIEKIGQDGVDHINTSSEASHMLGKIFSLHHPMGFHDPITDRDVKSLYHWNIFISDASLNPRLLTSNNTKTYTRGDKLVAYLPLLLAWGVYQKVTQNQDIMQVIKDIRVPFDCYITLETRTRTHSCRSYIAALQIVQRAVQRSTFPQLWRLLPPEDAHQVDGKSNEDRFKAVIGIIYGLLESAIYRQDTVGKSAKAEPRQDATSLQVALSKAENPQASGQGLQVLNTALDGGFKPTEPWVVGYEKTTENQTGESDLQASEQGSQASEALAGNVGRGLTSPIFFVDENPFQEALPAALTSSAQEATENQTGASTT